MSRLESIPNPKTPWGLFSLILFYTILAIFGIFIAEDSGKGWMIRYAWTLSGMILNFLWLIIGTYLEKNKKQETDEWELQYD